MKNTYQKIIAGIFILGVILGAAALLFQFGIFQGVMASKTTRTNDQCATEERVFDEANKLTGEQEEKLRSLIAKKEEVIGADIILLTINEPDINDYYKMRDYAQNYYEENQFGWDKAGGNGIIYVDNWATGYCWLCTTGNAADKLDDDTISYIIDKTNKTVNQNPYKAYKTMIQTVTLEMKNFNLFQFEIPTLFLAFAALVVMVIVLVCNLMTNKGTVTTNSSTYVPDGGVKIIRKNDIFLHSHVSRRKIEKADINSGGGSGGGHIGGSGGHGGGGGRH